MKDLFRKLRDSWAEIVGLVVVVLGIAFVIVGFLGLENSIGGM